MRTDRHGYFESFGFLFISLIREIRAHLCDPCSCFAFHSFSTGQLRDVTNSSVNLNLAACVRIVLL